MLDLAAKRRLDTADTAKLEDKVESGENKKSSQLNHIAGSDSLLMLSHRSSNLTNKKEASKPSSACSSKAEQTLLAGDIADSISGELKTIGLISALLSSWGCTVYSGEAPPEGGLCFGPDMVKASLLLFWISLGWFFLCVSSTLVIMADLDSIPSHLLIDHFHQPWVMLVYQIPELSVIGGVVFFAFF
jgi:hypothetical protein